MEGGGSPIVLRLALFQYRRIQIWRHRHLPVAAVSTDELDIDTWVSQAPIGPNSRMMITLKLAPIAYLRIWDQFNQQNLVYRFMGPVWRQAQALAHEFRVFSLAVTTFALISQSALYTITGSNA